MKIILQSSLAALAFSSGDRLEESVASLILPACASIYLDDLDANIRASMFKIVLDWKTCAESNESDASKINKALQEAKRRISEIKNQLSKTS